MGVPAFFRWLTRKYPSVIVECVEKKTVDEDGNVYYDDVSSPNPNQVEFDNLYLDMNGIIHPCTHPEDKPPPKNEDEMMVAIFECIDRLFNIVRPRKLLYMAIDGVAPRAKMNQQRSRRFRASKEAAEKTAEVARIRDELRDKGCILPPEKPKETHFDSNCITPGTPFMDRLSKCLQYYIHDRMNNHNGWKGVKVILSDANVPGEGEHKIMDYIRKQRSQPDHDPNTHHVLCGADADLIMLGLATHETHFTIIREEFLPNKDRPCDICAQMGHEMKDCTGLDKPVSGDLAPPPIGKETQFIFVRLNVLKEYLQKELDMPNLPFQYDFERIIDDWVFLCFFVGNDFLPHLPSLEIREHAIDRLVSLYKKCVYKTQGYLTESGSVKLERVEMIMTDLGYAEDEIFKERQKTEERFKARNKRMKREREQRPNFSQMHNSQFAPTALGRGQAPQAIQNVRQEAANFRVMGMNRQAELEAMVRPDEQRGIKRKAENEPRTETQDEEETPDEVRLWEDGFKDRYYESKFDVSPSNMKFRSTVALEYVRGLCWVLKYYYQGCVSWEWYFPFHYAPFASDFRGLDQVNTKFELGTPFKPLEQLMGVFPAASRSHVPPAFGELMMDPKSPIIDFYPIDFKIDLNGKKFAWQGVALLPFVDEKRLFKATEPKVKFLTQEERLRNKNGEARLYISNGTAAYKTVKNLYDGETNYIQEVPVTIDTVAGVIVCTKENIGIGGCMTSPIPGLHAVSENSVFTVTYLDPKYPQGFIFPSKKLENAKDQPKVLGAHEGPVIGFNNQRRDRANLDASGHRTINFHTNQYNQDNRAGGSGGNNFNFNRNSNDNNRNHASIAPPANLDRPFVFRGNTGGQGNYQQQQRNYSTGNNYQSQQQRNYNQNPNNYQQQHQQQRGGYNGNNRNFQNNQSQNQGRGNNSYQRNNNGNNSSGGGWRRY